MYEVKGVRGQGQSVPRGRATTVGRTGETGMLDYGYVNNPGKVTRLGYSSTRDLREAGFAVLTASVPTSLMLLPNPELGLVTGNGPQTVDIQAEDIRGRVGRK
ncbi:hypothetical protein ACLQ3K_09995 [Tsukamurella sp. DT100]|uniref:hypothetical protein n=1 Tax=Tsukamurella sp. DT100 TaxID=3393415 RepID=UPI003CFB819B